MYRLIILSLVLLMVQAIQAQSDSIATPGADSDVELSTCLLQSPSPVSAGFLNHDYKNSYHWGVYRTLRAVGWSSMGLGVVTFCGGLFLAVCSIEDTDCGVPAVICLLSGAGLTVASIPILVVAYHHRYKAKHLRLDVNLSALPSLNYQSSVAYSPAIGLRLTF